MDDGWMMDGWMDDICEVHSYTMSMDVIIFVETKFSVYLQYKICQIFTIFFLFRISDITILGSDKIIYYSNMSIFSIYSYYERSNLITHCSTLNAQRSHGSVVEPDNSQNLFINNIYLEGQKKEVLFIPKSILIG